METTQTKLRLSQELNETELLNIFIGMLFGELAGSGLLSFEQLLTATTNVLNAMQGSVTDRKTFRRTAVMATPILGLLNWGFLKEKFGVGSNN